METGPRERPQPVSTGIGRLGTGPRKKLREAVSRKDIDRQGGCGQQRRVRRGRHHEREGQDPRDGAGEERVNSKQGGVELKRGRRVRLGRELRSNHRSRADAAGRDTVRLWPRLGPGEGVGLFVGPRSVQMERTGSENLLKFNGDSLKKVSQENVLIHYNFFTVTLRSDGQIGSSAE
jgi:hypothetical protein